MANGHAALALVAYPEPEVPSEIERPIGEAMAAAAAAVGWGLLDGAKTGKLDQASIARGGRAMSKVVELQLSHFGNDFGVIARRAGREEIQRRCGDRLQLGPADTVDELLTHVLVIAARVVELERARAH
jgi:hypothetical protein